MKTNWRDLLNGLISAIPFLNSFASTSAQSIGVNQYINKIDKLRDIEIPTQKQLSEAQALYDAIYARLGTYGSGRANMIAKRDADAARKSVDTINRRLDQISEAKNRAQIDMYSAGSRPVQVYESAIKGD